MRRLCRARSKTREPQLATVAKRDICRRQRRKDSNHHTISPPERSLRVEDTCSASTIWQC
ncbi:hypothetical protein FOCG_18587 [Fusarium oxysporum f. sp. radicis-lycopersici 26381]|nr:hypothetical protein FOCG_18587 [Fusarium oxysporum f. sp. radicis-lycopersici 26381]